MSVAEMHELSYILNNIENYNWSDALFLPEEEAWDKHSKGMVLDPDDVEDDEDDAPQAAKQAGLGYALGIQTVKAIVQNAAQQKPDLTEDDLVAAFLYYYDNDAFIVL